MRRVCLILVLAALTVPSAALALTPAQTDGSLAVSGGSGTIVIHGRGVVFGRYVQGSMLVIQYKSDDPADSPSVSGATVRTDAGVTTYAGSDVRFLLPAGRYTIELIANGIDVSAVGRGTASAPAGATLTSGSISVDGGRPVPFARLSGSLIFSGRSG